MGNDSSRDVCVHAPAPQTRMREARIARLAKDAQNGQLKRMGNDSRAKMGNGSRWATTAAKLRALHPL